MVNQSVIQLNISIIVHFEYIPSFFYNLSAQIWWLNLPLIDYWIYLMHWAYTGKIKWSVPFIHFRWYVCVIEYIVRMLNCKLSMWPRTNYDKFTTPTIVKVTLPTKCCEKVFYLKRKLQTGIWSNKHRSVAMMERNFAVVRLMSC